jgi:hypothetical protein
MTLLLVSASQALHTHTFKSEWIVNSSCTHLMAKYASIFSSPSKDIENKIFVVDYYALTIFCCGKIECQNCVIIDVYHVPIMSAILFYIPQLTQNGKMLEFWSDQFVVKDMHNKFVVVAKGILDLKGKLYNFFDPQKKVLGMTPLIAEIDGSSRS